MARLTLFKGHKIYLTVSVMSEKIPQSILFVKFFLKLKSFSFWKDIIMINTLTPTWSCCQFIPVAHLMFSKDHITKK